MKVKIRTASCPFFEVFVDDSADVEDLKVEIANSQNLSFDQIILLLDGELLTDEKSCHGIGDNRIIEMVVKKRVTIKVSLELPNGNLDSMEFEPSEKISDVKQKIQNAYDYNVENIELGLSDKIIKGGRLSHYSVGPGSTLQIKLKDIKVNVCGMDGKKFELEIGHDETVKGLKKRLHGETTVLEKQQTLLYGSKQLSTGTLSSYGIQNGSSINMVGRQRGG